jgi:hypothetical protein
VLGRLAPLLLKRVQLLRGGVEGWGQGGAGLNAVLAVEGVGGGEGRDHASEARGRALLRGLLLPLLLLLRLRLLLRLPLLLLLRLLAGPDTRFRSSSTCGFAKSGRMMRRVCTCTPVRGAQIIQIELPVELV